MAEALSFRIVDLIPMGGDLQIRLRPTRHTGGRQHADEGS
jgi:diaminohydroxyphosphoribosylaminopyrimidine deaminase/5-amino-6-(5-phosphoribosylamino)uracil reductase